MYTEQAENTLCLQDTIVQELQTSSLLWTVGIDYTSFTEYVLKLLLT